MPKASRSPRTRCTCLSAPTRPSAVPRSESRTSPVWQGRSRADSTSVQPSSYSSSRTDGRHLELGHAAVARVGVTHVLAVVLLGAQPDGGRLDPHRQVLGDQGDVLVLVGEVARHGQDPGVVVAEPEAGRQRVRVGVVELDPDRPALLADRDGLVEAPVRHPELVERSQRRPREEAELGMMTLRLELGDHDDGQNHLVLGEPAHRARVGQQHAGVEDERAGRRSVVLHGFRRAGGPPGPLLGLRHQTPLTRPRGHSTPGPVLPRCGGPGGNPKAGVPAPWLDLAAEPRGDLRHAVWS